MAGKTDLEDAIQRLDVLTKEENLMTAARNLEVTHCVDVHSLDVFIRVVTNLCPSYVQKAMNEQQRSSLPHISISDCRG
jgi:hypothetical protein